MPQINFDADAARDFQMFLMNSVQRIEQACAQAQNDFSELGGTWKDTKYTTFARLFEETMQSLHQFNRESEAYLNYLYRKEKTIREYLESGY